MLSGLPIQMGRGRSLSAIFSFTCKASSRYESLKIKRHHCAKMFRDEYPQQGTLFLNVAISQMALEMALPPDN